MPSNRNWSLVELLDVVADPSRYAGGGAVAAMSLAGAAATLELVARLSARRKRLAKEDRERLSEIADRATHLRAHFQAEIDADMEVLNNLMTDHRELREARKGSDPEVLEAATNRYQRALIAGIESPLNVADEGLELLDMIADCQPKAVTFTMSDLGAAAATVGGATQSMLLMAEVNLNLLEDQNQRKRFQKTIDDRFVKAASRSDEILSATRSAIRPDYQKGA